MPTCAGVFAVFQRSPVFPRLTIASVVQIERNQARLNCRGAANTRGEVSSGASGE